MMDGLLHQTSSKRNQLMKTSIKNLFTSFNRALRAGWVSPALIAGLGLIPAGRVTAQSFTILHSFAGENDGANPNAGLILSGDVLYGTAYQGGSNGDGTVFAVGTNGAGFTTLHGFAALSGYDNSDGADPYCGLVLSGSTLYGTAYQGGNKGSGTIFALNTNGAGFATLYDLPATTGPTYGPFLNSEGASPTAGLILSSNILYGTAELGGSNGTGTVFALNTNGTDFTILHVFLAAAGTNYPTNLIGISGPNLDGAAPFAGVILSGDTLYGTAVDGGSGAVGTVFKVNVDGTGFTVLHGFTELQITNVVGGKIPGLRFYGTNSDGASPAGGVILSGSTLYGTASAGGLGANGVVFAVNTNGTDFTILYNFTGGPDGGMPEAGLVLSSNILYGTTAGGGTYNYGTVFQINTDGTGMATLYSFTGGDDGAQPQGGLILSNNTLYGTAINGGSSGNGTLFSLGLLAPSLGIAAAQGDRVALYWPASSSNYVLQTTTNLASSNWTTVTTGTPIIGVTLPNIPPGSYYRLQQQ
jgi:uncharacterized repeat protein (TIGR03803 family)